MYDRLITRQEVEERTGLSRSTIYRLMASNEFPKPVKISRRAVRWSLKDILDYIRSRLRGSNSDEEADEDASEEADQEAGEDASEEAE